MFNPEDAYKRFRFGNTTTKVSDELTVHEKQAITDGKLAFCGEHRELYLANVHSHCPSWQHARAEMGEALLA